MVLGCVTCFKAFKFVLVRVLAVLGCAWLSWLFYVAFLVIGESGCFMLFQIVFVVIVCFYTGCCCLGSLKTFCGCLCSF